MARQVVVASLACALLASCGGEEKKAPPKPTATAPPQRIVAQIPGAPSTSEPQASGTFVGAAGPQRSPYVAVVAQGAQAVVYLCDGRRRSAWFGGPVKEGKLDLRTADGTRLNASVSKTEVKGTVALPGDRPASFTAVPAREVTGLYVFDDPAAEGYKARWIVTANGLRGISTATAAAPANGLAITTAPRSSGGGQADSRFAGVSGETQRLLTEVKALNAELAAARSENVSLREALGSASKKKGK